MANAEMLIPLILLLVLLHLFRSGKKHGPLIQLTFIASLLKIEVTKTGKLLGTAPLPNVLRVLSRVPFPQILGRIA